MPLPHWSESQARHRADHAYWRITIGSHVADLRNARTDLEVRAQLARVLLDAKGFWERHFVTFDRVLDHYLKRD